jgi:hypothetical protein
MSNWPGNLIRKTPVTPAGPFENGAAPGVWSLSEASFWTKQGLWPIAGNEQLLVENVFSTWLYTGNGSTQTITNGINLSGRGGLVWRKSRGVSASHILMDTSRGIASYLVSNLADAAGTGTNFIDSFNSNGFTMNANSANGGTTYASWTFREAPKFFDIVTYTGNSTSGGPTRTLSHNLGIAPGMVIIKCTTTGYAWVAWHRSASGNGYLNTTAAFADDGFGVTVTATTVSFVAGNGATNANGDQYVMYLYAHDTASDGIIQCGSLNNSAGAVSVTLGWEPQWLLFKRANSAGDWYVVDNMRGMAVGGNDAYLSPNLTDSEQEGNLVEPTATGFRTAGLPTSTNMIYMAIRRGPMRTPTLGTSVFMPISRTGTGSSTFVSTSGFPSDNYFVKRTDGGGSSAPGFYFDRLRGGSTSGYGMSPASTAAENSIYQVLGFDAQNNNGVRVGNVNGYYDASGQPYVDYHFRRAPGFFDTVCWTCASSPQTIPHNLGVVPELIITKQRNGSSSWFTASQFGGANYLRGALQTTGAFTTQSYGTGEINSIPTASNFAAVNFSTSNTYVSYLFASAPGVSKVGTYTGTGALQTINCAFTTGARFVLIKRTDSTGDWYVWDSARGISSGNDPYTLLNTSAAQVTGTNYVDTTAVGFQVTAAAPAEINASGATYIFLAIA